MSAGQVYRDIYTEAVKLTVTHIRSLLDRGLLTGQKLIEWEEVAARDARKMWGDSPPAASPGSAGMVSEVEAVKREWAAAVWGWEHGGAILRRTPFDAAVRKKFPLPTVERPRTAPDPIDPLIAWRAVDGRVQYLGRSSGWEEVDRSAWTGNMERIRLWADLLARPTERVPNAEDA